MERLNDTKMGFWHIAVDAPLMMPLTYSDKNLSDEDRSLLKRGVWVTIPLANRQTQGMVLGPAPAPDGSFDVKSLSSVSTELPIIDLDYMKWLEWLADYYIYPVGEIMATVLPPLEKATSKTKTRKAPVIKEVPATEAPVLTDEQQAVVSAVNQHSGFAGHLIFGVTGSGKTEIYMRILADCMQRGQKGLLIVPEISLTPQLLNRFTSRFGQRVATIHSHLTPREKTNQWWQMVEGEKQILIGARSALFCPIPDLGVIIVDEEHEPSFKQEDYLKYHARDSAVKLAQIKNIPILMGSATPSLESWNNAIQGRYLLHRLRKRVEDRAMPEVQIVDLKQQRLRRKEKPSELPQWLSEDLLEAMRVQLDHGKQVAIFLNRRGFANVVQCPGCGFVLECPNCDISLTLHGKQHLVCHYCDYQQTLAPVCTNCQQSEMVAMGLGTEQIESDLGLLFPSMRMARADRDEISSREDIEDLVARMEAGDIDILIGTQMIAKGLDFANLNLVGIVNADVGLHMPDFRAAERGFQIITQVSGRSGRHVQPGESPGKVIIQTYTPNHPAIVCAQTADYESFATEELRNREELLYPPFGKIAMIRIVGTNLDKVLQVSDQMAHRGRELQKKYSAYQDLWILGPCEYPLARLRNQHRYQVLVKGSKANVINTFVRQVIGDRKWIQSQVKVQVDVDPMNML